MVEWVPHVKSRMQPENCGGHRIKSAEGLEPEATSNNPRALGFRKRRHLRRGSPDRVPALTEGDSGGSYFEGEPVCASGTVCRCGGLDPALTECVGVVLSSNARAEP